MSDTNYNRVIPRFEAWHSHTLYKCESRRLDGGLSVCLEVRLAPLCAGIEGTRKSPRCYTTAALVGVDLPATMAFPTGPERPPKRFTARIRAIPPSVPAARLDARPVPPASPSL